jgi:hypothetical protein
MPTFARVATSADLPTLGARETPSLDFKAQVSTNAAGNHDTFEAAKDVAAMASVYGGVLLIGACENSTTGALSHWRCMPLTDAQQVVRTFEQAVRSRCVPVPLVDPVPILHPTQGDYVVAVNVLPVLHQPVGVRVRGDRTDGWGADTFVFPARLSTHTLDLRPDQLAMLMNPDVRRVMILLEGVPATARNKVRFTWHGWTDDRQRPQMGNVDLKLVSIDPLTNSLLLEGMPAQGGLPVRLPLDDVDTAWEVSGGEWCVRVSGAFDLNSGPIKYVTRPK